MVTAAASPLHSVAKPIISMGSFDGVPTKAATMVSLAAKTPSPAEEDDGTSSASYHSRTLTELAAERRRRVGELSVVSTAESADGNSAVERVGSNALWRRLPLL
eukprot:CAMPEP_0194286370 /NCGR_PEP_ID=MMETSP0169-20130528/32404_1 /TAXON_ID=218684 /ORGANISM="Corethron pennatum, Strain L29A3" /LENGTH=103 /DNA_ID=CAMNT_0039032781 /DNA_START=201 /DNA_END=508 /DNA_ORIENTATION=-